MPPVITSHSAAPPVILLIGPTGSGKSSFVRSVTKENVDVNGQKPCTVECTPYSVEVEIGGRKKQFILVDTPGFEDLPEENLVALKNISDALQRFNPQDIWGAVYFHRITDGRLTGTTRSVLSIFKAICGLQFFPNVVVVTTMWDAITPGKRLRYEGLNNELERNHLKISNNARGIYKRLHDDGQCSKAVLEHFAQLARSGTPPILLLMKEQSGAKRIGVRKTTAGREIMKQASRGNPSFCTVL